MEGYVGNAVKNLFDPKVFLAKVGAGKTILEFHKNQKVFAQGEAADTIFTFKRAGSSSRSCLSKARKR
jgi:CRP/FNR family transcriptional regulator, cyclic AMP receptor protein